MVEPRYSMIAPIPFLSTPSQIVLSHQERFDGRGYPRNLDKQDIHIGARIFAVADTLDAITSDRPYRNGTPLEGALTEIKRLAGTQFDPKAVEVFLSIPPSEWVRIRDEIALLESNDKRPQPAA